MSIYTHIKRCLELSDRDIASAVGDRRLAKALLDQLAKVSRPGDGAPKLLLVFAKMATSSADWIDGALRVEMVGDADVTVVEVLSELGLGMHERVFPSFKMAVPLEEFARAVERVPHMIEPLSIATSTARRLVLTSAEGAEEEDESLPEMPAAPSVSIGDDSLYSGEKRRASKDKMFAVKGPRHPSSNKHRAVRRNSKPDMAAVRPKVIAPNSGKTLRPMAPAGDVPIGGAAEGAAPAAQARAQQPDVPAPQAPPVFPKLPPLPRIEDRTPPPGPAPAAKGSVVARVSLTKIQVPRGAVPAVAAKAPAAPRAVKRGPSIRPPAAKGASKPPPKGASKPPAKGVTKPPPKGASKPPARGASKPPPKGATKPPPSKTARPSKAPPRGSTPPKSTRGRGATGISEPPDEEGIDQGWDEGD